jgi:hypothetical protein
MTVRAGPLHAVVKSDIYGEVTFQVGFVRFSNLDEFSTSRFLAEQSLGIA